MHARRWRNARSSVCVEICVSVSGPGDGIRPDGRLSTSQPSESPLKREPGTSERGSTLANGRRGASSTIDPVARPIGGRLLRVDPELVEVAGNSDQEEDDDRDRQQTPLPRDRVDRDAEHRAAPSRRAGTRSGSARARSGPAPTVPNIAGGWPDRTTAVTSRNTPAPAEQRERHRELPAQRREVVAVDRDDEPDDQHEREHDAEPRKLAEPAEHVAGTDHDELDHLHQRLRGVADRRGALRADRDPDPVRDGRAAPSAATRCATRGGAASPCRR